MTALRLWGAAGLAVLLPLVGCSSAPRPPAPGSPATLAWFQPERFPDLPLYQLGPYRLRSEPPQLALSTAGGAARRLCLEYATADGKAAEAPAALLTRLAPDLASAGWAAGARSESDRRAEQRWTKGDEELVVAAGRDGDATTVRLLLGPAPR